MFHSIYPTTTYLNHYGFLQTLNRLRMLQKISIGELRSVKEEGVGVCIAGIVISMIFGLFYAFGGYAFYMSMHTNIRLDDYKKFFLIFPAMYLVVNLSIPLGERLLHNKLFKGIVASLILLLAASVTLVSMVYHFWIIAVLLVGVVSPILGTLYTLPFHCTSKYFPTYHNMLNGIFLASQGFGAALFTVFLRISANPNNQNLDDPFNKYWIASGLRLLVFCFVLSALFVWKHLKYNIQLNSKLLLEYEMAANMPPSNPKEMNISNGTNSGYTTNLASKREDEIPEPHQPVAMNNISPLSEIKSVSQGLLSRHAILVALMSFTSMNGFLITSSYKVISQIYDEGEDATFTQMACLGFLLFGTSRVVVRWLIEKMGFKTVFMLISLVQLFTFYSLYTQKMIPFAVTVGIFIHGCYIAWFNMLIPRLFGYRHAAKLIQVLLLTFWVSNVLIHILSYKFSLPMVIQISGIAFLISNISAVFLKDSIQWT